MRGGPLGALGGRIGPDWMYGHDLAWIHQQGYEDYVMDLAPHLLKLLPRGRVVDLACGPGAWAHELARKRYRVWGLDISPGMIRLARRRVPRATFVCGSMVETPLPECDAVTALGEAINYVLRPRDVRRVFRNVRRSLRPGGRFILDSLEPPMARRRIAARVEPGWAVVAWIEVKAGVVTRRIRWFRGRRSGTELHRQRLYASAQLAQWLRAEGFRVRPRRRNVAPGHVLLVARRDPTIENPRTAMPVLR